MFNLNLISYFLPQNCGGGVPSVGTPPPPNRSAAALDTQHPEVASSHQQLHPEPDSRDGPVGEQRAFEAHDTGQGVVDGAQLNVHLGATVDEARALQPRAVAQQGVALLAVGDGEQHLGELLVQLQDVALVQAQHHVGLVQDAQAPLALAGGQRAAQAVALLAGLAQAAARDAEVFLGRLVHHALGHHDVEAPVLPEAPAGLLLAPQRRAHGCMLLRVGSNATASLTWGLGGGERATL